MRKVLAASLLALSTFSLVGCSSMPDDGTAQLNVHKAADGEQFVAHFDRALFTDTADGQTDLILLSGTTDTAAPGDANAGADADSGPSVRQVVHVRVLWQPTRTIRLDSPSAGNAMIDWHVTASDADRVVYAGSCYAKVSVDGDEASVDLREANVSVRQVIGHVTDPLQRAKLDGKFVAKRADATVRTYVEELDAASKTRTTAAMAPAAENAPISPVAVTR